MSSTIDTAFKLLEQAIRLEEHGERSDSNEKLNAAAIHYFQACNLLKSYLLHQQSSNPQEYRGKKQLLEQKIDQYECRGKSLIRKVRGEPAPYILVDGEIIAAAGPASSSIGSLNMVEPSAPPFQASFIDRPTISAQQSLSMIPLPQAYPVTFEEAEEVKQEEIPMQERITKICREAESMVKKAIDLDNSRTQNRLAQEAYKIAAELFLQAIRLTGDVVESIKDENGQEEMKKYHNFLKDRVEHILDRVEQLQKIPA